MNKFSVYAACSVLAAILISNAAAAERSPYRGTPVTIPVHFGGEVYPAQIQAESFDEGGEGIAYHDTDVGNNGGTYRTTDVDIDSDGFSQVFPGHYVGWTRAGEWLEYTVNVLEAGYYFIEPRIGSQGQGGTFHIEFNGVDKTGPFSVPDTGGWRNYKTLARQGVYLDAGVQIMRIALDAIGPSGSVANIDWIEIGPSISAIPGASEIKAALFDAGGEGVAYHDADAGNNGHTYRDSDVDIDDAGFGRSYIGWTEAGEWLQYTVNVQATAAYRLNVQVASEGKGGAFHIEFDGVDKTGRIDVPDTGGWRNWTYLTVDGISLNAGLQKMRIVMDEVGPSGSVANIASLFFHRARSTRTIPLAVPGVIHAENFDDGGEGVAYHDVDAGNNGGFYRATDVDIDYDPDPNQQVTYVGWTRAGEWLAYTVAVEFSAYHSLEVRFASEGQGGTFHIEFDDVDITGPIAIPDTGGWRNWQQLVNVRRNIFLGHGEHLMRIVLDSVGPSGSMANIDYVAFSRQVGFLP
jgi:hypothetical protein